MTSIAQSFELAPKKIPSQQRSRDTVEALVEACTGLLPRRGYAGTTTNHIAERAGVSVASLYEYFPGKDAIVALVAERLVERVLARLSVGAARVVEQGGRDAVARWIALIYETVAREKELVAVFLYQVPYTNQLAPIQSIGPRLLEFSQRVRWRADGSPREFSNATLHLLINLVTSTIMQLVFDPPGDATRDEMLAELSHRTAAWLASDRGQPTS